MPRKLTYEYVKNQFEYEGFTLLSEKYINSHIPLKYNCRKEHIVRVRFSDFKRGIEEAQLHCHHITGVELNPIESADVDNCIILCKKHHKQVHKLPDCGYRELKCKALN